ncbi:DUF2079 domain-containing protein [Leptodesmis sichuanensis]|uniref:DUF2079 domain-containing protein n=1 Tax=Leptodesmis sichuanensis TaxID=2906798 RepID=UPI001F2F2947|nr:DUF2079 domain-containing protein [Leptodesmis sichuanensis]
MIKFTDGAGKVLPDPFLKPAQWQVLTWMIGGAVTLLLFCSSLRHALYQSTAWDLGIFDQAVYLISQGLPPISSLMGFHILGDHAAVIFYPLALLYKLYPDVHWLLLVQAIALSLGALPLVYLARLSGLSEKQAIAIAAAYLLYPLIFNVNLFDFHPDVIAVPALLWAVLSARLHRWVGFCLAVLLVLSCKAPLGLTVIAMGLWLLLFEKRRWQGAIAIILGLAWFLVATRFIIPHFGAEAAPLTRHLGRYSYLGTSFSDVVVNLLLKPWLLLGGLFTFDNLEYLVLLFLPVLWGLSWFTLTPLIGAIPPLMMNLLSTVQLQKDLIHQYSLPILPFLFLAVILTLAQGKGWIQNQRGIIIWSLIGFLLLSKFGYFAVRYMQVLDTWQATREAIAQVPATGNVLTTAWIAPHLTHRPTINLAIEGTETSDISHFNYVLLNVRHPGWRSSPDIQKRFVERLQKDPRFKQQYQRDDVYLFVQLS